jgi:predicted RNA-binding protein with PIN domain
MKILIIDGHNALNKISFLKRKLDIDHEAARNSLIELVNSWRLKQNYSGRIYIVFDGQDDYLQQNNIKGPVTVIFSRTKERADDRIISMVRNTADRSLITIITCDEKDIGRACRPLGARIISPDFLMAAAPVNNKKETDKKLSLREEKEINDELIKIWNIS